MDSEQPRPAQRAERIRETLRTSLLQVGVGLALVFRLPAPPSPVYRCPWAVVPVGGEPPCGRKWNKNDQSPEALRAEVWDHIQAHHHLCSELADIIAERVR